MLIEDMAFDDTRLFHADTGMTFRSLNKNIKASKAKGVSGPKPFSRRLTYRLWHKQSVLSCHV